MFTRLQGNTSLERRYANGNFNQVYFWVLKYTPAYKRQWLRVQIISFSFTANRNEVKQPLPASVFSYVSQNRNFSLNVECYLVFTANLSIPTQGLVALFNRLFIISSIFSKVFYPRLIIRYFPSADLNYYNNHEKIWHSCSNFLLRERFLISLRRTRDFFLNFVSLFLAHLFTFAFRIYF